MPFGLSGWQRYSPYLPGPASPALGCQDGLPEGNPGAGLAGRQRGWARASVLLRVQRRAEVPHRDAWVEQLKGCSGGGRGRKGGGFRPEKRPVGSPACPRCFPEPLRGDGEFPAGAKPSPGRTANSQTWPSALPNCLGCSLAISLIFLILCFSS